MIRTRAIELYVAALASLCFSAAALAQECKNRGDLDPM